MQSEIEANLVSAQEDDKDQLADPGSEDLAAIEAEWPLIAAELELVNAEVAALAAPSAVCELARRRVRRAEARVLVEARAWAARQAMVTTAGVAA